MPRGFAGNCVLKTPERLYHSGASSNTIDVQQIPSNLHTSNGADRRPGAPDLPLGVLVRERREGGLVWDCRRRFRLWGDGQGLRQIRTHV